MEIQISDDYESMSKKCVNDLLNYISNKSKPVICAASGDTPKGMYKQLVTAIQEKNIDVSHWYFVGLDEWCGMNGNDEGSCRYHLNKDLFEPLNINESNIIFFDGRAYDLSAECERIEKNISDLGGIDIAVLGIGTNGHVGMNEPGTDKNSRAHVANIHAETAETGQKYFTIKQRLTHGLTLGIGDLMETNFLMLLANGKRKSGIIKKVVGSKATSDLPASLLSDHQKLIIYLDKEAASCIEINAQ